MTFSWYLLFLRSLGNSWGNSHIPCLLPIIIQENLANYRKVSKHYDHHRSFWVAHKPDTGKYLQLSNKGATHTLSKKTFYLEQPSKIAKPSFAKFFFFYLFIAFAWNTKHFTITCVLLLIFFFFFFFSACRIPDFGIVNWYSWF